MDIARGARLRCMFTHITLLGERSPTARRQARPSGARSYEYREHRFQVAVAVRVVGLQIAALGPLVPAVDGDQGRLSRVGVGVVAHQGQGLGDLLGRVVLGDAGAEGLVPRVVVPAERDVREIRDLVGREPRGV